MNKENIEYEFQLASHKDEQDILAVYKSILGTEGCTWNDDYPSIVEIKSDIELKSLYCLKNNKGKIVAAASAGPFGELDDFTWDDTMTKPCELARIGVVPSLQKIGVASGLLDLVIGDCKIRGFDSMRFLVSKTNYNALALYGKFGFQQMGETFRYGCEFFCYYKILK